MHIIDHAKKTTELFNALTTAMVVLEVRAAHNALSDLTKKEADEIITARKNLSDHLFRSE